MLCGNAEAEALARFRERSLFRDKAMVSIERCFDAKAWTGAPGNTGEDACLVGWRNTVRGEWSGPQYTEIGAVMSGNGAGSKAC